MTHSDPHMCTRPKMPVMQEDSSLTTCLIDHQTSQKKSRCCASRLSLRGPPLNSRVVRELCQQLVFPCVGTQRSASRTQTALGLNSIHLFSTRYCAGRVFSARFSSPISTSGSSTTVSHLGQKSRYHFQHTSHSEETRNTSRVKTRGLHEFCKSVLPN